MYGRNDVYEEYLVKTTENDFEQKAHLHIVVIPILLYRKSQQNVCAFLACAVFKLYLDSFYTLDIIHENDHII